MFESIKKLRIKFESDEDSEHDIIENRIQRSIGTSSHDDHAELSRQSPSSSLSIGSILDTPNETILKKKLSLCEKRIKYKNRLIDNLRKKNKRLIKRNINLKKSLSVLIKRKGVDGLFSDLSQNVDVIKTCTALNVDVNVTNKKKTKKNITAS